MYFLNFMRSFFENHILCEKASRLAELIANKKGESYSSAISWIRAKVSFVIVHSAILCLRGSRSRRQLDFVDSEFKTLDCLKELLIVSEPQGMYLIIVIDTMIVFLLFI